MSFIRINDERTKLSSITSYCEMQNMSAEDEARLTPLERAEYEAKRHALAIFCDHPQQNTRSIQTFPTQEALQEALARLDAALPHHHRMNEWRMNLANVVRVRPETDHDGRPLIILSTPHSHVYVREEDATKRTELLAQIDAKLEQMYSRDI